jgi:uncharacterized protein with ParB-like and HNH nuclease domain
MEIAPDKQNIDRVFSNTTYYIDFYQRDYKWTSEPVLRLLDDIFYKFNIEYTSKRSIDPSKETVNAHYSWYYFNTYITNTINGKVFIVDGQQRLTTLSLILIKLYHLGQSHNSKLVKWIENKIAGQSGFENEFWMNHIRHKKTQQALFDGKIELKQIDTSSGITAQNMVQNYKIISQWLDQELQDLHKYETFVFYFLNRLVLINLSVEQTDVPMVFEVINDRGVKLKPYEILKGKLLGQIDKVELDKDDYNGLWEKQVTRINSYAEDEIDEFFSYYLKAKFSDTRKDGTRFDNDYHREMFKEDLNKVLNLKRDSSHVKSFLKNEFTYFTNLYSKISDYYDTFDEGQPYVYYNALNGMDGQFLLILSACSLNDKDEDQKIKAISYELDRFFSFLQLQGSYDSNSFNDALYRISSEIRDQDIEIVRQVFDKYILEEISSRRIIEVKAPFQYTYFKNTGINLNTRFKRYYFARIEKFLADNMNLNMKHFIGDLVLKTGHVNGFHIEHILSYNDDNLALFNNDEDVFEQERNRLGGTLLLKGRDNISSNNEPYKKKLKTYANTLYWNETLREDSYKSKLDFKDLINTHQLEFEPYTQFGPEELENRHQLLYRISEIIWN